MLDDRSLIAEMAGIIRQEHANAEWAVRRVEDRIRRAYLSLDDQYFRERVSDIESVLERLILNLTGAQAAAVGEPAQRCHHRFPRFQPLLLRYH